jgi:hypothetical protein
MTAMATKPERLIHPRDLLDRILSREGWRCVATKRKGKFYHAWFSNNEKAEDYALTVDQDEATWVYHACATYQEPGSRKQENVWHIKCYWLDIDCGQGKRYADQAAAWRELHTFCTQIRLPMPLVVASGSGLHCYWILSAPVTPEEWQPGANSLKAACQRLGLHADPARTADCASILRPPGTRNMKPSLSESVREAIVDTIHMATARNMLNTEDKATNSPEI